jgi:hypothetical protein
MRVSIPAAALCAVASIGVALNPSAAQSPAGVRVATASPAVEKTSKFTFILFWKENNAATQELTNSLKAAVEKRSQRAEWKSVNVNDAAQRAIVERYHVERAPMPMVLSVAANGAITGAITRLVTDEAIEQALVTPRMADAAKALQDKRIVVIQVQRDAQQLLPAGVTDFTQDPLYKDRTTVVSVVAGDRSESRFLTEMEIKAEEVADSAFVVIAPPGVLVGKYSATVTKDQMAADLHAAGKCCNDPNCKHNQKGK